MKRKIILTSIVFILLVLFSSCDLTPMEEGRSVNEYIFPYVKFTLSDDGSYYSASILEGAAVSSVYIPAYIENNENGKVSVRYFTGFENDEDIVNLESTTIESSSTEIKLNSLDQASLLNTLKYNTVDEESTIWKNLPSLPHTEDEEFIGWFLVNNPDVRIYNGSVMVPGYTTLFPKWGTHTFKEMSAKEPTCTESGWEAYHYCTNSGCGYTTKVEVPALGHSLIKHEKSAPTCVTVGYTEECWQCTRCGKYFSDSAGETEIEDTDDLIIPYSGHTADGTIYHDATNHWKHCSVCDKDFDVEKHTYGSWYESGDYRVHECTYCSYKEEKTKEHSWLEAEETESTCTMRGHKKYWYCTAHDGEYALSDNPSDSEIIDETELHSAVDKELLPHTLSSWVNIGDETHWKECSSCHNKFDEKEHEYEYTFSVIGKRNLVVSRSCTICGAKGRSTTGDDSAFDISAVFGKIKVKRELENSWTISYYGDCTSCYWADENGERILDSPDEFTLSYSAETRGEFKIFCYAFDGEGELSAISLALLTAS